MYKEDDDIDQQYKNEICSSIVNPSQISFVSTMDRNAQNRSNVLARDRQGLSPFDSILDMYKQNPLGNQTVPI